MSGMMKSLSVAVALSLCAVITAEASAEQAGLSQPDLPGAREGRADRLRTILQLQPAQEPALQSYLAALEGVNRRMKALAGPTPATMPERTRRMQRIMAEGVISMDLVAAATNGFYNQLDPGQKRAYDVLPMQAIMHGERQGLGMAGGVMTGLDPLMSAP